MIQGVQLTPLKKICDERGRVQHLLRRDWPIFKSFGEAYFSVVHPGVVKGWHLHKVNTLNYTAISGMIKCVLYDARTDSPTHGEVNELFLGEHNYQLVTIPPGIWNGVKGISATESIIAIVLNEPYDPAEVVRVDPFQNDIPYDWALKHG
ncbi:MAG TPA: dTDP-4-dehydrorhamnose 3,5-epimerase family protein [Planctomycetota bacterium]|jgi:dTDP-4-dehydrorhamnose 3,5-epimerase|nr:dTDP-4-dehydrorhamnose 3,5-epimerase family protein [Planctomycetota bacterium]